MNTKKPNANEGGQDSQNPHNAETAGRSLLQSLEPSLWNSKIGRRAFVKKTGAATVGTAIALHGFRMEVMASGSPGTGHDYAKKTFKVYYRRNGVFSNIAYSNDFSTWATATMNLMVTNIGIGRMTEFPPNVGDTGYDARYVTQETITAYPECATSTETWGMIGDPASISETTRPTAPNFGDPCYKVDFTGVEVFFVQYTWSPAICPGGPGHP